MALQKYVGYCRVSTTRQGKSGLGLSAQQEAITEFAARNGVMIAQFTEIESGKKADRPVLWEAIRTAQRQNAKLLIARLDRFSRRVSFIAQIMDQHVSLVVAEMPHASDFQLHIFAALAQEERRMISARTKEALQAAKRRGVALGTNGKKLAATRKREAEDFGNLAKQVIGPEWPTLSYAEIARQLTAENFRTRNGGTWCAQLVKAYFRPNI